MKYIQPMVAGVGDPLNVHLLREGGEPAAGDDGQEYVGPGGQPGQQLAGPLRQHCVLRVRYKRTRQAQSCGYRYGYFIQIQIRKIRIYSVYILGDPEVTANM